MYLHGLSINLLNYSAFFYLFASISFLVSFAFSLGDKAKKWTKFAVGFSLAAFILHTSGLGIRWYLGGLHRPPWTNLYESLLFFAFGASVFQQIANFRWKVPVVGAVLMPLVFLAMGMSVMTPNKQVEPLIPALKSVWILIHVVFANIAYGAFAVAACFGFLHLLKIKVPMNKMAAVLCLMMIMNLSIAGRKDVFKTGQIHLPQTVKQQLSDGSEVQMKDTYREYEGGAIMTRTELVPYANIPFWLAFVCFIFAGALFFRSKDSGDPSLLQLTAKRVYWLGLASMTAFLLYLVYALKMSPVLGKASNPYLMLLVLTSIIFGCLVPLFSWKYKSLQERLPSADRLHELSYKNVMFGFPFQTLLLITGAIWAYEAWGRSWGWDPKETWALITWFVFLIYLHGKLLFNWKPKLLSVLTIIGLFVVIFAFLGVNLVLSGLHSYGSA